MKYLKKFNEGDVSKMRTPYDMIVGYHYKITEPNYDDFDEGLDPEKYTAEVIKKTKFGVVLRDITNDFTFDRDFQHLLNCEIEEID